MTDPLADALRAYVRQMVRAEMASHADQPQPPRLYSIQQAADLLGVARSHLYRYVSDGTIRTVRIGGRRLVSEAALAEFIAAAEGRGGRPVVDSMAHGVAPGSAGGRGSSP
jgi:excisionase family DNA binding protein